MYRKVLIPLDGSAEADGVFPLIKGEIAPGGEVILLHVMPPTYTDVAGEIQTHGSRALGLCKWCPPPHNEKEMLYLRNLADRLGGDPKRWRFAVISAWSVPRGIVNFARREGVDLIAMYTHDRKGLARLIKGSIASGVRRQAPSDVKVFKPHELAAVV